MRRKLTKKNTMNSNDEGEVVDSPEAEENDTKKSPDPPQRMGISNIARSLTVKKKIVFKEKPIKWEDRIAYR